MKKIFLHFLSTQRIEAREFRASLSGSFNLDKVLTLITSICWDPMNISNFRELLDWSFSLFTILGKVGKMIVCCSDGG